MGNTLCAVIEYENESEACNCCRELNLRKFQSGMRCALLGPRLRRNLYKVPANEAVLTNSETLIAIKEDGKNNSLAKLQETNEVNGQTKWSSVVTKKSDSGCDSASSHSGNSKSPRSSRKPSLFDTPMKTVDEITENPLKEAAEAKAFDRAPGSHRKQSKMNITISSVNTAVHRQPRGPVAGIGFGLKRMSISN